MEDSGDKVQGARTDLLLTGGTVIDPAQGIAEAMEVAICGERIAGVGENFSRRGNTRVVDCTGLIVTPGLIDLHVHIYSGVEPFSIAPDPVMLESGVTTVLDAGSSGSITWPGMRDGVLNKADVRALALVNLCSGGMVAADLGELLDPKMADLRGTIATIRRDPTLAVGVKLRAGDHIIGKGEQGWKHLRQSIRAARETDTFVMVHIGNSPMSIPELVEELRPGDVLTHCYKGGPYHHLVLDGQGKVFPRVKEAMQAGVIFDVGHGTGSFDWEVAARALDQGLTPTTISTDLHSRSVNNVVFDLPTTMTKFHLLGFALPEIVERCTLAPARVLGREDQIGTLRAGSCADLTLLRWVEEPVELYDSYGQVREYDRRLEVVGTVRAGRPFVVERWQE